MLINIVLSKNRNNYKFTLPDRRLELDIFQVSSVSSIRKTNDKRQGQRHVFTANSSIEQINVEHCRNLLFNKTKQTRLISIIHIIWPIKTSSHINFTCLCCIIMRNHLCKKNFEYSIINVILSSLHFFAISHD